VVKKIIYLCINCKQEFTELPPQKGNECISGYYHKFIKKSDIISDDERKRIVM